MRIKTNAQRGFTLIEMIGVLAVIAILAAVLIPKVFEAINSSRVNNAAMACQSMKTACVDHYAKFGALLTDGTSGTPTAFLINTASALQFDKVLLGEQLADKLLTTKISDPATTKVMLMDLSGATAGTTDVSAPADPGDNTAAAAQAAIAAFDLDSTVPGTAGKSDIAGSVCAVAVLTAVAQNDAWELSKRIDGDAMSAPATAIGTDYAGRVKYNIASGPGTVYVYLTHR